jgi:hypothetical protein
VPEQQYIVANGEFRELIRQVAVLTTKVEGIENMMGQIGPFQCPVHTEQIKTMRRDLGDIKSQVVSDRKITVGVSAVTAAILVALKWIFIKGA